MLCCCYTLFDVKLRLPSTKIVLLESEAKSLAIRMVIHQVKQAQSLLGIRVTPVLPSVLLFPFKRGVIWFPHTNT
jgi:hypothetical protein